MKRNLLHTIWVAAVVLLAASCEQEELPGVGADGTQTLAITVTDGGYAPADRNGGSSAGVPQTRAVENGYITKFTAGDACGLYIVRGGELAYANVKLTATADTDGTLTWQPEAGVTLTGGFKDEAYFLYYPYQEDADMKEQTNASAIGNDAAFFDPLITGWIPKADQSIYTTGYTASDLMTATGTATKDGSTLKLSFSMEHRMALAVIELPDTKYVFTNTGGSAIPDYTVPASADFTGSDAKPCRMTDGSYRYIVNPTATAPEITGNYADGSKEFIFTPSATTGSYKTYKIDGGRVVEKQHNLQVGDYLLADGNLLSKETDEATVKNADVAAIVFWTPAETTAEGRQTPASLQSDEVMAKAHPNCTHGLAVSLKDVSSAGMKWQDQYEAVVSFQNRNAFDPDCDKNLFKPIASNYGSGDPINFILGYQNTLILRAYNEYCKNTPGKENYVVLPVDALDRFAADSDNQAPSNSTGWFLPSPKELHILCYKDVDGIWSKWNSSYTDTRNIVDNSLNAAGGEIFDDYVYWSSSERAGNSDYDFAFRVNFYSASVDYNRKNGMYKVRAVCAF